MPIKIIFLQCIIAIALANLTDASSGPIWCTKNLSGEGPAHNGGTKSCCPMGGTKVYYTPPFNHCMGPGFHSTNVDQTAIADCCKGLGLGSHGYVLFA
jgi:hypothetical protein